MNRLNIQESEDKHMRNIALKATKHKNNQVSSDEIWQQRLQPREVWQQKI